MAAALQARGAGPGVTVGLLGPTSRALVTAIQATWLTGATVAMLPLPMRLGSIDEFVEATRRRRRRTPTPRSSLVDPAARRFRPSRHRRHPLDELTGDAARFDRPTDRPRLARDPAVHEREHRRPEGRDAPAPLRDREHRRDRAGAAFDLDHERVASWLPLYHDMGLIGLLGVPMTTGVDLVLAGPQDFLAAPLRWLDWMSTFAAPSPAGPTSRTRSRPRR